ncbi:MAG: isoprenylcysteine carboxylmethyltransferase family protein [Rhizomicrobium sp.]|nr:isoprenylcysteine carboxylmethyltransferase family protein [Rhizomicrobium sp.]
MGWRIAFQQIAVVVLLGGLLFGLAESWTWSGAWVLIGSLTLGGVGMNIWLLRHDPALLRERLGQGSREKPLFDRILLPLANVVLLGWLGLMALDIRWHGQPMPLVLNLAGGFLIVVSFAVVVRVLAENSFATAFVRAQPERGQRVISSGPYRFVRHPMYSAAALAYVAIPFTLGSYAGLWGIPLPILILAVRIPFEEEVLRRALPAYDAYMAKVRYRLVPFVW